MAHTTVAAAASAGGTSRSKPAQLSMSFSSDSRHHRLASSVSSFATAHDFDSDDDDEHSPPLSALDSSAALILVHDQDDSDSPLEFSDDEEERNGEEEDLELVSPMFELRKSAVFPPLPPSLVFLYLLVPYLRLGALNMPYTQLPLKFGLPALLLSAAASAFARQIWYMLARYLRKANMTDVVLDTFARARGNERRRAVIRGVVRAAMGGLSVLMSVVYFRYAVYTLYPVLPTGSHPALSYVLSTLLVSVIFAYLSYARSLNYRRIIFATWLSVVTYLAWLGCVIYAHTQGILEPDAGWLGSGSVWLGLATTTFAFCSSSTLPLYASLKSTSHPVSNGKLPASRSFRLLSFSSAFIAVLLLLPSTLFSAFPNHPASASYPIQDPTLVDRTTISPENVLPHSILSLNSTHVPILGTHHNLAPALAIPDVQIHTVIRVLAAVSLLLSIPSVIVATPPIAIPSLRSVKFNVPRVLTILVVIIGAVIPPSRLPLSSSPSDEPDHKGPKDYFLDSSGFFAVVTLIVLFMGFTGTYFVPTFVHVSQHFFKRPLAIVVPPRTPLVHTPTASADVEGGMFGGAGSSRQSSSPNPMDELLLRKERALQKRQFRKRIVWDVGVWMLLGASGAGVVGFAGYLLGVW